MPPDVVLTPIAGPLSGITAITHAGDGRIFLTLHRGQILVWDGATVLPTPFLDISSLIVCCGEQGLLSTAFHPNYAENGFFYVNYTNTVGDTVVARYSVSSDSNVADPFSGVPLLTIDQPFDNHNGGQLQFGPDGYLYIGMGDGGGANDPECFAQRMEPQPGARICSASSCGSTSTRAWTLRRTTAFPRTIPSSPRAVRTRPGRRACGIRGASRSTG